MKRNFFFMVLLAFLMLLLPLSGCAVDDASEQTPIIFTYATHGNNGFDVNLVSILPDGTEKRRITTDSLDNHASLYSPDGKYIAFLSAKSGITELHLMDVDGSNMRQITSDINNDSDNFVHFLWLPDSQHIVLERDHQWYLLNIDTKEIQVYGLWQSALDFYPLVFSHDGTQLLYLSSGQLHIQDQDGSNDYVLTNDTLQVFEAFWSSDDSQVIFSAKRSVPAEAKGNFYTINVDGSNMKAASENEFDLPVFFALSPSGEKIVFYAEPMFSVLDLKNGRITELFQTEYPDTIYSITW